MASFLRRIPNKTMLDTKKKSPNFVQILLKLNITLKQKIKLLAHQNTIKQCDA